MVSGFLGTMISLERAVALRKRWSFGAPLFSALGAVAVIAGFSRLGAVLFVLSSIILVADYIYIHHFQPTDFTRVMGLGAFLWIIGNLIWAIGKPVWVSVPWWAGYLILTIAGERLEMSRLRGPLSARQRMAFTAVIVVFVGGMLLSALAYGFGVKVMGAGLVGLAFWLYQRDIARFTVRQKGLVRFIATGMLTGYGWLVLSGVLNIAFGGATYGYLYDAQLHALFLGYVISMIMAHAPIILPAVTGMQVRFLPAFYLHLGLLQTALAVRIVSDLAAWSPGRMWGGMFNEVAVIWFLINTAQAVRQPIAKADKQEATAG